MSLIPPLLNYTDIEGRPVCPTCGRPIMPAQAVMRVEDCMIHASCYVQAQAVPEPCEYTP
jgi:hypothetical protein